MRLLHLLAGPNGAGKTTLYERSIGPETGLPFVNADEIARAISGGGTIAREISVEAAMRARPGGDEAQYPTPRLARVGRSLRIRAMAPIDAADTDANQTDQAEQAEQAL